MSSNDPIKEIKQAKEHQEIKLPNKILKNTDLNLFVLAGQMPPRPLAYAYAQATNGSTSIIVSRPSHGLVRPTPHLSHGPVQSRSSLKPIQRAPTVKSCSTQKPIQKAPSQRNAMHQANSKITRKAGTQQKPATLFSYPRYSQEEVRAAITIDFDGYVGNIYREGIRNSRGTCIADNERDAMADVAKFKSINCSFISKRTL